MAVEINNIVLKRNEGLISNQIDTDILSYNQYDKLHEESKKELSIIKKEIKRMKWKNGSRRRR